MAIVEKLKPFYIVIFMAAKMKMNFLNYLFISSLMYRRLRIKIVARYSVNVLLIIC